MCVQFDFLSMTVFGERIPALLQPAGKSDSRWSSFAMNVFKNISVFRSGAWNIDLQ